MKRVRVENEEDQTASATIEKRLRQIESNINVEIKSVVDEVESKIKELKTAKLELLTAQSEWNTLVEKIESTISKVQNPIKLDVGGRVFKVSKETLMSVENTYFYGLIANMDKFKPLDDGTFFIERDSLVFDRILNYLRTGKMDTRGLIPYALDMLKDDLDYYCIPLPTELQASNTVRITLCWYIEKKSPLCDFSNNNLTATKNFWASAEWDCYVIGNIAVDRYTVKINKRGAASALFTGGIRIGFTTGTPQNSELFNILYGWFINVKDGSLFGMGAHGSVCQYSTKICEGDYITVIRQGKTIRFEKNKIDLGVCKPFIDIPNHPLYPAVSLRDANASVSLVNDY